MVEEPSVSIFITTNENSSNTNKGETEDLLWYVNHGDVGQVAVRESECDDYHDVPVVGVY